MKSRRHYALAALVAGAFITSSAYSESADEGWHDVPDQDAQTVLRPQPRKHHDLVNQSLESCIRENLADAEAFCADHPSQCAAERSGVRRECEAELRGKRHSG